MALRESRRKAVVLAPIGLLAAACAASAAAPPPNSDPSDLSADVAQAIPAPTDSALPDPVEVGNASSVSDTDDTDADTSSSADDIPDVALAAYQRAAIVMRESDKTCGLDWELIAAIGYVESGHGTAGGSELTDDGIAKPAIIGVQLNGKNDTAEIKDTDGGEHDDDTKFDRAVGPMQFIPSSWSSAAVDADGDGERDPQNINDAALATAVYLCNGDDDLTTEEGQRAAAFRYNHSDSYVDTVLAVAEAYRNGDPISSGSTTVSTPTSPAVPSTSGIGPEESLKASGSRTPQVSARSIPPSGKPSDDPTRGPGKPDTGSGSPSPTPTPKPDPDPTPTPTPDPDPTPTPTPDPDPTPTPDPDPTPTPDPDPTPGPATPEQLKAICAAEIETQYPDATDVASEEAILSCSEDEALAGLTEAQATEAAPDVVAELAENIEGLEPS